MRFRSRTDIISEILQAADGGETKSRIMWGAYLSHDQAGRYLPFLVERGLLVYERPTRLFKPTEKGLRFLSAAKRLEAIIRDPVAA